MKFDQPYVRMSHYKGLGTLFVAVLLLVIIITNVTMRGLWSVLVIMMLVMISIILYVAELWDVIFQQRAAPGHSHQPVGISGHFAWCCSRPG